MGANASMLGEEVGDCHSVAARRRNNAHAFAKSVAALREEVSTERLPLRAESVATRARVVLRKRPLFPGEVANDFDVITCQKHSADVWEDDAEATAGAVWVTRAMLCADARTMYGEHHAFYADAVFDEGCSTNTVYAAAVRPLVQEAFFFKQSDEATLVCFGQTGSGKTFTLNGLVECVDTELASSEGAETCLWRVCALEIAGAIVRDLLQNDAACVIRDAHGYTHVLHSKKVKGEAPRRAGVVVTGSKAALEAVRTAASRRSTHATGVHDASSRTHAVYRLERYTEDAVDLLTCKDGAAAADEGVLTLVDLAGSEWNSDQFAHSAPRRREAQEVNASLSTLKACLNARLALQRAGVTQQPPTRESALTRVLRTALTGRGKLVLIATVSPASADAEHAIDTLRHTALRFVVGRPGVLGGVAEHSAPPCGARVLTRRVRDAGAASLDSRGPGAAPDAAAPDAALPDGHTATDDVDPLSWSAPMCVAWWLDAATEAVLAINSGEIPAPQRPNIIVRLSAAQWPARTKLGLAFYAPRGDAEAPIVAKVGARTPLAYSSVLIRAGAKLVDAKFVTDDDDDVRVQSADEADKSVRKTRLEILSALKSGAAKLVAAADALDAAKLALSRACEHVRPKLSKDAAILRAWVVGGEEAKEAMRRKLEDMSPEEEFDEAEKAAVLAQTAQIGVDAARSHCAAAEQAAFALALILEFEPEALAQIADVPRVPRHFSGESRLGDGDGGALVSAYADETTGHHRLVADCGGDARVAQWLFRDLARRVSTAESRRVSAAEAALDAQRCDDVD